MKQIIAIGGGGLKSSSDDKAPSLDRYIIEQSGKKEPKICFLPQAAAESKEYILWFYQTFLALGAKPSYVSLFGSVQDGWKEQLLSSDIIYVGGGNTRSMLALWREWGVDTLLRQAYEKGIILCGVSAGAICWFEQCVTDSVWPLGVLDCLGILPGSCCPHYDTESERRPAYLKYTQNKSILPGIALQDDVAAHYVDGKLHAVVSIRHGKKAYSVEAGNETELPVVFIVGDVTYPC
ncbi:peptidase E [Candidatus Dependentiae bacterium]|nr:peptidase E [Candidatus Dependentiae bacterium]MCC7414980.1 peptidase E [Campylobacterota bacterium]